MEKLDPNEQSKNAISNTRQQDLKKPILSLVVIGLKYSGKTTIISNFITTYKSNIQGIVNLKNAIHSAEIDGAPQFLDYYPGEKISKMTLRSKFHTFETENCIFEIVDTPGKNYKNMYDALSLANICLFVISSISKERNKKIISDYLSAVAIKETKILIIIINKMDYIHYSESGFDKIKYEILYMIEEMGIPMSCEFIPCSGINKENLFNLDSKMDWYKGKSLIETLEFR